MQNTKFLVNEIFDSFQGEGFHQGRLCTFVRLQGCSVGCSFCDSKCTWTTSSKFKQSKIVVLSKNESNSSEYALFDAQEILSEVNSDLVVITGGEPFEQDVHELVEFLIDSGKEVHVETSGCAAIKNKPNKAWYTISPKITKNTNLDLLLSNLKYADEIKVVPTPEVIVHIEQIVYFASEKAVISFQPESCKEDSKDLCIALAKKYSGRLSIQSHKYTKDR